MSRPHVIVLGGGFAGLWAAQALRKAPVEVTIVDRTNHHLFTPLLYQVATAGLSAPAIAAPIRHILAKQRNATVLLGEVTGIDVPGKKVVLEDGSGISYDRLIVATGSTHSYFGNDAWAPFAPGLKTLDDAFEIRSRILLAFERAEREPDLSLPGHPEIFVAGDLAGVQSKRPVPGIAPAAKQMGRHAAANVILSLQNKATKPFRYRDYGQLATIGRAAAVAEMGRFKLSGFIAWIVWLVAHIYFLINFRNRLVVLIDWASSYWTYSRYARIVTRK